MPEILISKEEIQSRIYSLAKKINTDFENQELVVVCVLKGAFVFCADLVRQIKLPVKMEFMQVSSYGDDIASSGQCQLILDLTGSISGKNVLIVEDIVDTGLTISYLKNLLQARNPKTLKLASLLYKPSNTIHETTIDYLAFEIENKFVVGYGLDYAGFYRELPYIGILNANL